MSLAHPELPIKAVAFDLDGLIFNTEEIFSSAAKQMVVERRGLLMPPDLFKNMMGRRAPESIGVMKSMLNLSESVEALIDEAWSLFFGLLDSRLSPMPGLFELLSHLEQCEIPKAVATSSPRSYLERVMNRFELLPRFEFALTAEDVVHGKPNPEIYLKAAQKLGVEPREMLVLEDSETGSRAAAAAGAFIVSVPHEFSRDQDFSVAKRVARGLNDALIFELLGPQSPMRRVS
mgnify:CR=1 FL=1